MKYCDCELGIDTVYLTEQVLFYPGPDGPLSSIRLENIGDGLEDYELFRRLKNTTRRDELITQLVQSAPLSV